MREGRIQLPGFYDGVVDTAPDRLAEWEALGFDEGRFLGNIGLSVPVGERGRAPLERMWARPTADINGIWGGYTGAGSKTVIAAQASAKVSFRLVPGQDPAAVYEAFKQFVAERTPADARVDVSLFGSAPGNRDRYQQPVGGGGARGAGGGVWPSGGAHGQRRVDPRGGEHAADFGGGFAADGVRAGGRPGAQPEREIRMAVLPPRAAEPCAVAG